MTGWLRDRGALGEYQAAAGPIMARHGGTPLLKSTPTASHVGPRPDLVVLLRFPTPDDAARAFQDPEYTALVPLREKAFSRLYVSDLG